MINKLPKKINKIVKQKCYADLGVGVVVHLAKNKISLEIKIALNKLKQFLNSS